MRKVFGKYRLKSIQTIEYIKDGTLIQTTQQLEIEQKIMTKNTIRFKLVYSLLIFDYQIIVQIGYFRETIQVRDLIHNGTPIEIDNSLLATFF